ncbi:MAG TPA: hypothetical protein DCE42_06120 [Myxococcales bacterium]|nr:hypothetical protein [Myxococcales bacterium]
METLSDLFDALPKVEEVLYEMQDKGRVGKTLTNFGETLSAFCAWCLERKYLSANPLQGMTKFDTSPKSIRRVMTIEELQLLLEASPPHLRLLFELAVLTGIRVNELRNLTVDHLDLESEGLHLDEDWTKNRKSGFQPLPTLLLQRLQDWIASGKAKELYRKYRSKSTDARPIPSEPLLFVPLNPRHSIHRIMKRIGIAKETAKGKLDFHALRTTYINLVDGSGATVKEAQSLARHSTPAMTYNVYGRTQAPRLAQAVESIAATVLRPEDDPQQKTNLDERKCVICVQPDDPPGETQAKLPFGSEELEKNGGGVRRGFESHLSCFFFSLFSLNNNHIHSLTMMKRKRR